MKSFRVSPRVLSSVGGLAAVLLVALAVLALFFPNLVQEAASQVTGDVQTTYRGDPRPEFIALQVMAGWYVAGILVTLGSLALAGVFTTFQGRAARRIAAGEETGGGWLLAASLFAVVVLLCVVSMLMPMRLFELTSASGELQRQAAVLAWAARNWVGGLFLGVGVALASALGCAAVYTLALLVPGRIQLQRIGRRLRRAEA